MGLRVFSTSFSISFFFSACEDVTVWAYLLVGLEWGGGGGEVGSVVVGGEVVVGGGRVVVVVGKVREGRRRTGTLVLFGFHVVGMVGNRVARVGGFGDGAL